MAGVNSIQPFPTEIDRAAFGNWLTGFVDGEGSFLLLIHNQRTQHTGRAVFQIVLRADDHEVLRLIQAFLGCGRLCYWTNARSRVRNAKPIWSLTVGKLGDLVDRIIPHFDRHPLRAKKAKDYEIWREAVMFLDGVRSRRGRYRYQKWEADDRSRFRHFLLTLRQVRTFNTEVIATRPPQRLPPGLFE